MAVIQDFILRFKTQGTAALSGFKDDIRGLADGVNPLSNAMPGLARGLGIVGATAGLAAGGLALMGAKAIELADEIGDLSDATGISAGQIANLKQSMIQAGGSSDSYIKSISKLSVSIGEAASGNEKYQKSFKDLGVYVTDANGKVRDSGDILEDVIKRLSEIEDPSIRASKAVELLGKEAAKIDWTQVSAGRDAVTDQQIEQLKKYRNAIDELQGSIGKLSIQVFGELAKSINRNTGFVNTLVESMAGLVEQTGKLLGMVPGLKIFDDLANRARQGRVVGGGRGEIGGPTAEEIRKYQEKQKPSGGGGGGFGATPEETLKAIAASNKRYEESRVSANAEANKRIMNQEIAAAMLVADERTKIELRNTQQIAEISLNLQRDIGKATEEINSQERLSKEQKTKELNAKIVELSYKAENEILKIKNAAAEENAKYRLDIEKKIAEINAAGVQAQVDEYKDLIELQTREKKGIDDTLKGMRLQTQEMKDRYGLMVMQNKGNFSSIELSAIEDGIKLTRIYKTELDKINQTPFLTDEEKNSRVQELNNILNEQKILIEAIATAESERQNSFSAGVQDQISRYKESITAFKIGGQMVESVYGNMMSALERFVKQGKFSFKEFANSIIIDLLMIEARANATRLFNSVFSIFGGSGTSARAMGGPVLPNQPYIVGEKGPEVFLPNAAGTIIPNNKLSGGAFGGGSASITYNINAVDAPSFKQMIARDPSFLYAVTEQGRKSIPSTRR